MMDDLTYLAMNCFKKINNEYENILIITSFTFTCLLLFDFQEEFDYWIAPIRNYSWEEECHKERRRVKEGEGVAKSYFSWSSSLQNISFFFLCSLTF